MISVSLRFTFKTFLAKSASHQRQLDLLSQDISNGGTRFSSIVIRFNNISDIIICLYFALIFAAQSAEDCFALPGKPDK